MREHRAGWLLVGLCCGGLLAGLVPATGQVAFTAYRDGLWVAYWQPDLHSEPRPVGRDLGLDASAPALSPDGGRLAFETPGRGLRVCSLQSEGRCHSVRSEIGSVVHPAWDPRSGELAVVRHLADGKSEDSEILLTRGDLGSLGPLVSHTGNQDDPDFSPDGRQLVYSSAQTVALHRAGIRVVRHLWIIDFASGEARPLSAGAHQDIHPDWSPDGTQIAFASDRSGQFEIWVVNVDGGGSRQLTSGSGMKTWPTWSPDGASILYTRTGQARESLWLVDSEAGGEGRPIEPFGPGSDIPVRDPDWR